MPSRQCRSVPSNPNPAVTGQGYSYPDPREPSTLPGGSSLPLSLRIDMPLAGSSGGGEVMNFDFGLTAVL
jgi:hypothetical protein